MKTMIDAQTGRAFYAEDAERSILGSIMRADHALKDSAMLNESDFWLLANRKIFAAARLLQAQGRPIDAVTIGEQLGKMGALETAGGMEYLIDIWTETPSAANAKAYAARVLEASTARKIRDIGERMAQDAADPMLEMPMLVDTVRNALRGIAMPGGNSVSMQQFSLNGFESLERRSRGDVKPIKTGIASYDSIIGGVWSRELTVIGSRPGVGKSALALQIAMSAAQQGKHVLIVSLEMGEDQLWQRVYSNRAHVDGMRIRDGEVRESDWERITAVMPEISCYPITFEFTLTYMEDIRMEAQRRVDTGECDLLIVDYLQLVETRKKTYGETERVGIVSRALKQITRELKIPVVALAQVNRQSTSGGKNDCPTLSELRSSGQIEQDADVVTFIHQPTNTTDTQVLERHYNWFNANVGEGKVAKYTVLSVAKNRQGKTGVTQVAFDPAHMLYFEI